MVPNEIIIVPIPQELTLSTVEALTASMQVMSRSGGRIILDLHRVTIMTTPGIGLLIEVHRGAQQAGGSVVIARPGAHILDLIKRTQLHRILTIASTVDEAVDALAAQ